MVIIPLTRDKKIVNIDTALVINLLETIFLKINIWTDKKSVIVINFRIFLNKVDKYT